MISISRSIMIALLALTVLVGARAQASNELGSVRLSSCNGTMCVRLSTASFFRSTLQPNVMAFAEAKMVFFDAKNPSVQVKQMESAEGYYDLQSQVIVMRGLKNSMRKEMIYEMSDGKFLYF